jgi:hypothetical protein
MMAFQNSQKSPTASAQLYNSKHDHN